MSASGRLRDVLEQIWEEHQAKPYSVREWSLVELILQAYQIDWES